MVKNLPASLPLDLDELSDLPVLIGDWQHAIARQMERIEGERNLTDGFFLVLAAHQLLLVCLQYAEHDPRGDVAGACKAFGTEHPDLRVLRNMLMHSDEYYRGVGNERGSSGRRTFTYVMNKWNGDWHLSQGDTTAGQCNLSKLQADATRLASSVLAASGPGRSWLEQMGSGAEYQGRGTQV